jgi:hypothetical protein
VVDERCGPIIDPDLERAIFDMAAIAQWAAYFGDDDFECR